MPATPLKVLLKTPFSPFSGYGSDGFGLLRALRDWGCDVYPQPTWLDVPIPRDLLPLFARELRPPFDLLVNHWDPANLAITREARACSRVAVAWTMWEFAAGPGPRPCARHAKWQDPTTGPMAECTACRPGPVPGLVPICKGRSKIPSKLRWFDMVLTYDEVSMAAVDPYIPAKVHRGILQGGYDSRRWQVMERDWHEPRFGFIMHGALNERKAPWTAIEAFNQLKFDKPGPWSPDPEQCGFGDATLALHSNIPGTLFPELNQAMEKQRVRVFIETFDPQTLAEFYRAGHCLVLPSRGEGKNLPALEFLTTGGTVAVTDFGGHRQWLSADIGYPLAYKLRPSFEQLPWACHDARVSVEHLKDVLWHIYTHREEARQKGERGARLIPMMCDWSVVLENLFRRIRDTVPGPGPQIYDKAMACRREQEADGLPEMVPGGWRRG